MYYFQVHLRRTRSRRLAGAARLYRTSISSSPRPRGSDSEGAAEDGAGATLFSPREGDPVDDSDRGGGETSGVDGQAADGMDGEDVSNSPAVLAVNVSLSVVFLFRNDALFSLSCFIFSLTFVAGYI